MWKTPPEREPLLSLESTVTLSTAWVMAQPPVFTSNRRRASWTGLPPRRCVSSTPIHVGESMLIVVSAAGAKVTFADSGGTAVVVVNRRRPAHPSRKCPTP